jgi:hypothetical protein
LSYNSLHYDLKGKEEDPRSKWHRHTHTYFAADMDDDPHTEDNTWILNEMNEFVELDVVSVENNLQSFERMGRATFQTLRYLRPSRQRRREGHEGFLQVK